MNRIIIAGAAALCFTGGGLIVPQPAGAQTTTVVIEPAQRARIKDYVVQQRMRPATIHERVSVGTVLPEDVDLVAVPETWGPGVARYRYVYTGDNVVLVDPSTRRVVQIVE